MTPSLNHFSFSSIITGLLALSAIIGISVISGFSWQETIHRIDADWNETIRESGDSLAWSLSQISQGQYHTDNVPYDSVIGSFVARHGEILAVTLYDQEHRMIGAAGHQAGSAPESMIDRVFLTKGEEIIEDRPSNTVTVIRFIDTIRQPGGAGDLPGLVSVIVYDYSGIVAEKDRVLIAGSVMTSIALFMVMLFSGILFWYRLRATPRSDDDIGGQSDTIPDDHPEKNSSGEGDGYREVWESIPDLLCRFRKDGTIIAVNPAFAGFFGVTGQDSAGTPLDRFLPPEPDPKPGWRSIPGGNTGTWSWEQEITDKTGSPRWIEWTGSPSSIREGADLLITGRDITTRKRVEADLRESLEKNTILVQNLPDYILVHRENRICLVNPAICSGLGYAKKDLIGTDFLSLVHPADLAGITTLHERNLPEGTENPPIRIRSSDGQYRSVLVRMMEISCSGDTATQVILSEIPRFEKTQKKFRKMEERYRNLIEQLNEGIWVVDQEGRTLYTNRRMEEILGYSPDEMKNILFDEFFDPEMRAYAGEQLRRRQEGYTDRYQITFRHRDGHEVFAEISATPQINARNRFQSSLAVVTDITERNESEKKIHQYTLELERKNGELELLRDQMILVNNDLDRIVRGRTAQVMRLLRQKDEFVMQLGHDLRTPLTPIIALLPELTESVKSEEGCEILRIIERNIRFIQDIAQKSLKLARLNSVDIVPERVPVQVAETIHSVIQAHQQKLDTTGIRVVEDISTDLIISADLILFQELIDNLVGNALKFISPETGVIIIHAWHDGDNAIITISDNGIGLADGEKDKIFEEFFKSDRSRHDRSSIGLGLSICRRIVQKHGGDIHAESDGPGTGTTFVIRIPGIQRDDIPASPIN